MKTLFKKSLLVLMVAFIAVFTLGVSSKVKAAEEKFDFSAQGYANKKTITTVNATNYTMTFAKNNGSTAPAYYTTGTGVRVYAKGSLTVSSEQLISKIVFTFGSGDGSITISANVGAFSTNTWTGSSNEVVFTFGADVTKGHRRIKAIAVTYGSEVSASPSITVTGNSDAMLGDDLTLTATKSNTTSEVVWSSSDDTVATVANGVVTPVKMGTVTITAKLADDETVFASHSIKVYPNNENPITVAEAIEVCNLAGSSNSPYKYTVVGTVSSDPTYNEEYNSYTFNLTDETGTIKVYSSVGEGTPVNGNNVSVNGNLILYSSTCEFNYNSTFEILVDSNLADFLENLNTINSYMSLAYEYKTTIKNVAASENETISFTDTANRTVFNTEQQVWKTNGLTVTNNKASSTTNVANYSKPVRFYKDSEIILSSDTSFTTVVFESNANDGSKASQQYLTLLENSLSSLNANYSTEGTTVTLTLAAPVNTLSFVAAGQVRLYSITTKCEGGVQTVYENAEFRIKCAVDSALTSLSGLTGDEKYDWGISVTANGQTKYYNSTSEFIVSDDENNKKYVIISLGDVLNEVTKAKTEFTVRAYVEVDGDKYVSTEFKTYSVESMIKEYNTNEKYSDYKTQIAPLVEALTSLGCNVE